MTVAHSNLLARALRLVRSGEPGAADAICRHVLAVDPTNATALYVAGVIAHELGDHARSLDLMDRAVAAKPEFADAYCGRGLARRHLREPEAALGDFQRALALNPNHARAHFYWGLTLLERNSLAAAAEEFEHALASEPDMAMALTNLGLVRQRQGRPAEAVRLYRRAIAIEPALAVTRNNLASALQDLGQASEALDILRGLDVETTDPVVGANLLTCLNLVPGTPQEFCAAAKRWAARFADPLTPPVAPTRPLDPDRRLRIGYVAANGLRRHTLAMTYLPLFEAHDRAQVEVFAYSDLPEDEEDDVTQHLKSSVSAWRRTGSLGDGALADLIRADGIDILIDGIGFAAGSRLLAAARRPAPIQAHFPPMSTTGMTGIHYVIGDRILLPEGIDGAFTERLWRLPCGFLYQPLDPLPPAAAPPVLRNGFITFGSFNRFAKVGPEAVAMWAAVLNRLPTSRLIVRSSVAASGETASSYAELFAAHGVAQERLDFGAMPSGSGVLQEFNQIDIALDTLPFGGVLTTCAALAMGVPVVTWAGARIMERYGAAILNAAGFDEGIATDREAYVRRAVELAGAPQRLASLRLQLRQMLFGSPLCDGAGFARAIESAYRAMWRRWCLGTNRAAAAETRSSL